MYKIFKSFDCRTVKGTNLEIRSGTILKSYVLNPSRNSITLNFPDMTVEVEDDFDIKDYIIPMAEEDTKACSSLCDVKVSDEANYNKRINTAAVLDYFHKIADSLDSTDNHVIDWIASEVRRLKDEMKRLDVLTASDEDIIQNALMEYGSQECYSNDTEIANKITDVRNRYLELIRSY